MARRKRLEGVLLCVLEFAMFDRFVLDAFQLLVERAGVFGTKYLVDDAQSEYFSRAFDAIFEASPQTAEREVSVYKIAAVFRPLFEKDEWAPDRPTGSPPPRCLLNTPIFWSEAVLPYFSEAAINARFPKLAAAQNDFYYKLVQLCIRLLSSNADDSIEQKKRKITDQTQRALEPLENDAEARSFFARIFDDVWKRGQGEAGLRIFQGFKVEDFSKVAQNGSDVDRRMQAREMVLAREALENVFTSYLRTKPPVEWANAFKEAAKMAYNLQYMFREDVELATSKFYQALEASPIDQPYDLKDMFGSERRMFNELLGRALKIYGKGLIDQQALAKTDFANNPIELVQVVEHSMATMAPKVKLIAQMTSEWMRMLIDADKMPLTPHHTQVLAMLMFSEFYDQKAKISQSINTGGYNFNAAIMQMKTGEGKSIVIAMLAVFVVKYYGKKVHVLENNEGLLNRDFATYEPFFARFHLKCAKEIDDTSDICYCLKRGNNKFFNERMVSNDLRLEDTVLIVDEVDDLVVNENPLLKYMKPDREKSPLFLRYYAALKEKRNPPNPVDRLLWKDAQRIQKVASTKVENKDYMKGPDGAYVMLEVLPDGTSRTPKVPLNDDWLEYLNFTKFGKEPLKYTFFNALCTPYMYNKYGCIFGLTGSVGGEAERKYIKETYRAVAYEVPQFLKTCQATVKEEAQNLGVTLVRSHVDLLETVLDIVRASYHDVPVLVIARSPRELEQVYSKLKGELVQDGDNGGKMNPEDLQRLRERDADGNLLDAEWNRVIEDSTRRCGTGDETYCRVTVTEYFGGRGHDFNVMDPKTNENGGMLVVATSVPDTREWIQWKGRTARQDKRGQFKIVLSKDDDSGTFADPRFTKEFEALIKDRSRHDEAVDKLLEQKDKGIRETLVTYSSAQAKGAWLNELCESFYTAHPRTGEQVLWPSKENEQLDIQLRNALTCLYQNGEDIQKQSKDQFQIDLQGPPPEWRYPAQMDFPDGQASRPSVSVLFVIDASFSMDEVEGADERLSAEDRKDQDKMVSRLAKAGAELGSLTISLMWDSTQDLDLQVIPPSGEEINYQHRKSACGGELDVDANPKPEQATSEPVENVYWQSGPPGSYKVYLTNYGTAEEEYVIRVKQKGEVKMVRGIAMPKKRDPGFTIEYPSPDGQKATTRLTTCVECIKGIISEQLEEEDRIGLISFSHEVKREVPLQMKKGNDKKISTAIGGLRTRGRTAFYRAVLAGA